MEKHSRKLHLKFIGFSGTNCKTPPPPNLDFRDHKTKSLGKNGMAQQGPLTFFKMPLAFFATLARVLEQTFMPGKRGGSFHKGFFWSVFFTDTYSIKRKLEPVCSDRFQFLLITSRTPCKEYLQGLRAMLRGGYCCVGPAVVE